MLLLFATLLTAWACPPTADEVARARALFDDAEPEQAAELLESALGDLGCQTTVVTRPTLLELYRLQALVALARGLDTDAAEATLRAVTVDPLAAPPSSYGPELADLHRSWAGRLSGTRVVVSVLGGGRVFVDGEPLRHGQESRIVKGHHLLQIEGEGPLRSVLDLLDANRSVVTGLPSPEAPKPTGPRVGGVVPQVEVVQRRWRPAVLWVAGGLVTATGAGLTLAASQQERAFHERYYDDWQLVDRHAYRIQSLYIAGYSTLGAGGIVLTTGMVGLPRRRR